jgi:hypothetical protein
MEMLPPIMEGGSNGAVSDSRQELCILELGYFVTPPFKTASYKPTKSVGIWKIFRYELSSRGGLNKFGSSVNVDIMLELIVGFL